jgi:hypothetical protein
MTKNGEGEMLVEINNDNPIWREPAREKQFWIVRNVDDSEPENFPLDVINVNGEVIGTANDKDEYMQIWNANADNVVRGFLMGETLPFLFSLESDPLASANSILTENGEEFLLETSELFNLE